MTEGRTSCKRWEGLENKFQKGDMCNLRIFDILQDITGINNLHLPVYCKFA